MSEKKIELHDATPAEPGEQHGPGGPTHCADITVEYEYQIEQWLIDLPGMLPEVVRVVDRATRRVWVREGDRFAPSPWPVLGEDVTGHPWIGRIVRVRGGRVPGLWRVRAVSMHEDAIRIGPSLGELLDREQRAAAALVARADLASLDGRQAAYAPLDLVALADEGAVERTA